ncbi:MAG: HAMP domain-containing sensor histidine kinase [Eubacteriales bacterium]|nr:HAMP domain-containing sensor histidine kinase [Eubacteriales bacterium]
MNGRKNVFVTFGFVLSVSLIAAAVSVLCLSYYYSQRQFDLLNAVCGEVAEQEPQTKRIISAALKEYTGAKSDGIGRADFLSELGYSASDFQGSVHGQNIIFIGIGLLTGSLLFIFTFLYRNKVEVMRIRALAEYLEQVNTGKPVVFAASGEDEFSKLEDEIYKTVTSLYQTKDQAVQAKNHYAENLSNIAHQIKTPITAISLSVQRLEQDIGRESLKQVEKQLSRLTYLEETLLVLSRIDAGTLRLGKDDVDVYTLLVLAADNLQELSDSFDAEIDIPELGEMQIIVDLDWTMEAVMNLLKNCIEHNPGGIIHCSYAQNPLYTEILIWDDGEGFAKEDIPHLFERFYRGQNANDGSIGIGLALAKEIIERQNGTIRAQNKPDGGAFFEIRFYCH